MFGQVLIGQPLKTTILGYQDFWDKIVTLFLEVQSREYEEESLIK